MEINCVCGTQNIFCWRLHSKKLEGSQTGCGHYFPFYFRWLRCTLYSAPGNDFFISQQVATKTIIMPSASYLSNKARWIILALIQQSKYYMLCFSWRGPLSFLRGCWAACFGRSLCTLGQNNLDRTCVVRLYGINCANACSLSTHVQSVGCISRCPHLLLVTHSLCRTSST